MVWTRFRSLTKILHDIIPLQDIESLLQKIVSNARIVAEADYCAIIHSPDGETFTVFADTADDDEVKNFSETAVQRAYADRKMLEFCKSSVDPSMEDSFSSLAIEKCLVVPLFLPRNNLLYGVLYIDRRKSSSSFSDVDAETVRAFTNIAAIAIENSELFTRVTVDELTGAMSRNYFLTRLQEEFSRATRLNGILSMLMIDIDNFKDINDHFGHSAGDSVLKIFAYTARKHLRAYDVIARLGGDEFAVLLPGAEEEQIYHVSEKLHQIMEHTQWPENLSVTVSIGGTSFPANSAKEAADLLNQADMALYQAKYGGRKQAVIAGRQTPIYSPRYDEDSAFKDEMLTKLKSLNKIMEHNLSGLMESRTESSDINTEMEKTLTLFKKIGVRS